MSPARVTTLVTLELRQRLRNVAWYVLLGIFAVLLLGMTALSVVVFGDLQESGSWMYSIVVYFVLLLALLVSPTLSGNAINGDRDAATLAPIQVTLATTAEIVAAKFLAAWVTGLAFLVVAAPFLIFAGIVGAVAPVQVVVSLLVLLVEVGVVAAIGVGFSGILARPLFSVAASYLTIAALTVGTGIAFGLGGAAVTAEVTNTSRYPVYAEFGEEQPFDENSFTCGDWETYTYEVPRYDLVWGVLAANPFAVLTDATPASFGASDQPDDFFSGAKLLLRQSQIPPEMGEQRYDGCADPTGMNFEPGPTSQEVLDSTVPTWFVGLALQLVLAGGLLFGAWARTRTPAKRLPPGTRVA
ncbi:ABC transporter permease [Pseudoclavibacter sp. 8L]|uniref:ABC transporter permease n=1 Tax=Pseudoclavibacter sp. 8L TaxID=2653162 RepID=UPI0012F1EEFD|nr:ABC transporter permease [Pseudoclavibacter sp. 8L]VXC25756.1 ABC transporter permease [Pseudoclavibacter sp. 8L]